MSAVGQAEWQAVLMVLKKGQRHIHTYLNIARLPLGNAPKPYAELRAVGTNSLV